MKLDLKLLKSILSEPTAPYREMHVIRRLSATLREGNVPFFQDPVGNIVVGAASEHEYRQKISREVAEPVRFFIAHMDHPGFHGEKWTTKNRLQVKWFGGTPTKHLVGSTVWLADGTGWKGKGKLAKVKMHSSGRFIESGEILCPAELKTEVGNAPSLFGGFGFKAPVWAVGKRLYTKAADDLVGAAVITSLALQLWKENSPQRDHFLAVLTRAEEVGFIGAIGHFDLGWLGLSRRRVLCVSLETSRTLPGALIGGGPVVRLGDRATVFDAGALEVLTRVAHKTIKGRYQRRIMDGGTCEATVAVAYGFPSVGISIPLGNYHNQSFEGGPGSRGKLGPAPEFVHVDDIKGMLSLCEGMLTPGLAWESPWHERREDFRKRSQEAAPLLAW
jgi:putative aminopeptidase FrvX